MRLFNNMKLRTKLWLIGGIVVLGFVIITMQSLVSVKSKMLDEKRIKTMHLVESAYGVLDHFYKRTQAGSMTEKDAQAAAVAVLNELRYDKKEYFFINDLEPKIVLNPVRPEYVGKNASEIKDARGVQVYLEFVAIAKKDGAGFLFYEQKKQADARPLPKLSYVKLFPPWGWVIGTGIYIDDVEAAFWTKEFWITTGKMAFTGIIIILCILGFAAVVSASIFKQLGAEPSEVAEVVKIVAKGDLSVAITPKHGDTSSLLANMKDMVGQLKGMVGNIKSASMSVETGSGQLLATAGEISRGLETQSGKVAQIAAASEEMSQTIVDIAKNSVDMSSSASSANAVAKAGEDIVRKSIEEVKVTAVTISESAQKIQELGERSKQISKIVDVINNLADQTNLLALNAAIEAARAGEQGRGFAVVANEVRQLAERTAKATSEISSMVTAIQEDVGKAVFSMDGATKQVQAGVERSTEEGEALRKIVKSVGDLQATVQHIATSTEQMSATAEQISGDIQAIANSSKEITAESGRVSQESTDLASVAGNLEQVVGKFKL